MTPANRWQFWIDRGGTLTDVVGRRPDGTLVTHKLLSDNPEQYADAAVAGIRHLLRLRPGEPITPEQVECVKMGTTVATNALLERKGEPTVLVITRGFRDALRIAYQDRPRLFDRHIVLPELLYARVIEADERVGARGELVRPLNEDALRADLQAAFDAGLRSAAIVFMHGYRFTAHELAAHAIASAIGFPQISVSHQVSPLMKLVGRGDTTVVDAYLSPILRRYVEQVAQQMPGVKLFFMQSSGGLTDAHAFQGKDAILSGPAGGIVGMVRTAQLAAADLLPPAPGEGGDLLRAPMRESGELLPPPLGEGWGREGAFEPHAASPSSDSGLQAAVRTASGGGLAAGEDGVFAHPPGPLPGLPPAGEGGVSGPSGPVLIIGFDMGGTSTDVSHFAGEFERAFETQVAGVRMRAPMMSIHTVAAGGGSVLSFDGARFRAGPQSAGANPGPACYRRGGPLAVTDANVMVGKLQPAHFPKVFGPQGNEPLDREVVVARFTELAAQIERDTGTRRTPEEVAEGFIDIAVGAMANAIKKISVARGYDVTRYTLQCFGGAGGQHACRVADALGMGRVFAHPMAGVLSAYGMGLADQSVMREAAIEQRLADALPAVAQRLDTLAAEAEAQLLHQGVSRGRLHTHRRVHVRYEGTDSALVVPFGTLAEIGSAFEAAYRQRFAFLMQERALVVEAVSVEAVGAGDTPVEGVQPMRSPQPAPVADTVRLFSGGRWWDAALVLREQALPGLFIEGPAIIAERNATTVVEPGWRARVTALDHLVLERVQPRDMTFGQRRAIGTTADPVMLEVFNNLFMNIAEQMGLQLQNTAYSVNIKERLDFSCALFDAHGHLIANAPHMPVHLGSMSESIKTVIARNAGRMQPGDVFVLNDPYHGGTHLPDVTVVTPVYLNIGEADPSSPSPAGGRSGWGRGGTGRPPPQPSPSGGGRQPIFYVGSRGHHADIGGVTPGSMPPFSTRIEEEGVQIDNVKLVEQGRLREAEMLALLQGGPHPSRNPQQNLADLKAQIAANEKGVQELRNMVAQFGLDVVQAYMRHVQDNAEESVRRVITRLKDGAFTLALDNGAQISVAIRVNASARTAVIDFTGTSAQLTNNFNAPTAVCMAAVLYVFRTLVGDDIPLNAGCLKPLQVVIPEGSMLNPNHPASVVAGNVETSTCITNALYGALGIMAAGQCTMNNFTFGNARHQYYETISGGSGAGAWLDDAGHLTGGLAGGFHGTSVVQAHMTNSRLTDPEVLEFRFPVRLESYAIRTGSGGAGRWHGGDGGVRRVRFLEPMTASILSNGRVAGAFGMAGGAAGLPGINRVERADGSVVPLGHIGSVEVGVGDVFVIETPGGGGYGAPQ
ncbi:MAG: 5-oxoprolinase [Methylibium sp. NZG]|nr:MAG: 5-oxoprolinase [Methylibium sp. NZG]